jgi:peptidase E
MKLLLTSAGFLNKEISDTFLDLIKKPANEIHVIFIPTASRTKNELRYVNESHQKLLDLGITNITTLNLDHKLNNKEILNSDIIYVCGGNTFYLLQKIRESGFDRILMQFSGLYVGVSAGSIIVGPNIEVAAPWDENDVRLSDTTGLKLVGFAVIPHYQRKEKSIVEKLQKSANYEILKLTDNQAVLVTSDKKIIIGQP